MKNKRKIGMVLFAGCAALGGIRLLYMLWVKFLLFSAQAQTVVATSEVYSVGIIGGADGPTAILVAAPAWATYVVPCVLLLVGILGFWRLSGK